ncbi:MAG: DUF2065 family protein [Gammaproteobacteria bacterium]|nr:DUF2065 family protein [Gammaproteobacteria bacterium]
MMSDDLWAALALVMVLEGLLPSAAPAFYRSAMAQVAKIDEKSLRRSGLLLMVVGALLLYMVRS